MSTNRGRARYVLAAALLFLEAPFLSVLAVGAALTGALVALARDAQMVARHVSAFTAPARSPRPQGRDRGCKVPLFGHET